MRPDESGVRPAIGRGKSSLDVGRGEISVVNEIAQPKTGGMSVVASSPTHLPAHRKPISHGGSARGHEVFCLAESVLPETLVARQDMPLELPEHRAIEPREPCEFEKYREAVISTHPSWTIHEH